MSEKTNIVTEENDECSREDFAANIERIKAELDTAARTVLDGGQAHIMVGIGLVNDEHIELMSADDWELDKFASSHCDIVASHSCPMLVMKTSKCVRDTVNESMREVAKAALKEMLESLGGDDVEEGCD